MDNTSKQIQTGTENSAAQSNMISVNDAQKIQIPRHHFIAMIFVIAVVILILYLVVSGPKIISSITGSQTTPFLSGGGQPVPTENTPLNNTNSSATPPPLPT